MEHSLAACRTRHTEADALPLAVWSGRLLFSEFCDYYFFCYFKTDRPSPRHLTRTLLKHSTTPGPAAQRVVQLLSRVQAHQNRVQAVM